ncbi:hypothetical protein [Zhenhengia yiwuensis]|uniref:hypothetical protein n=1 Tax=Zhenhengia yiwuensis TaxID=2763666 RepID=UPI002A75465B|nr:hypothetical protein [Zhenhengia yiwuensis]MDY3369124.1 hypothetical protein [Zhenhengia yiwuensis]
MGLWEVDLKTGATIYVLAVNQNDAIYKAYKKVIEKTKVIPSNEGFEKWKKKIESIKMHYFRELDESRFNLH